jgi:Tfp pilus assembly protein PilX
MLFTVRNLSSRSTQRGAATLVVSLLLLFVASLGALYLNRGVLAEQKASGNQMQTTLTHEMGEAALEWATGMLNAPYDVGTACTYDNTGMSFRKRYVMSKWNDASAPTTDIVPVTTVFPGCKMNPSTGALTCSCPDKPASGTAVAALGTSEQPGFTVAFEAVPGDSEAVKVTAWACPKQADTCASTNFNAADGSSRLSVVLKLGPSPKEPRVPLTCGTSCDIGGSFNVKNTDVASNGVLVNAGSTINFGSGQHTLQTLSGVPTENAMIANDQSLYNLSKDDLNCDKSAVFKAYFGMTIDRFRDSPTTKVINCGGANDCKTQIDAAYQQGWRSFYFSSDLQLSGSSSYGSQTDPVTFVTTKDVKINGTTDIYGLLFSNAAVWDENGTGNSVIHGAQITCAKYTNNGNGTVEFDPNALKNVRRMGAPLARVPGSWRDFRINTDTLP